MTGRTTAGRAGPTLKDVAKQAGVSTMSASRALRGDRGVTAATRDRVLEAARTLGYRSNEWARSLKLGRGSDLIGVIVTHLANPFYSGLALGMQAAVEDAGKHVILGNTDDDPRRERRLVQNLIERGVDGIAIVPSGYDHAYLDASAIRGTPLVLAGRPPVGISADCVLVDDFGGTLQAIRRLLDEGHQRIAFIGNPPAVYTGSERYRGYGTAMDEKGLAITPDHIDRVCTTAADAEKAVLRMLGRNSPPTAVFAANNRLALGVLRAISARDDMAFAAFDDLEYASLLHRDMTLVTYDPQYMGRLTGELLLRRINEASTDVEEPSHWPASRVIVPVQVISQYS
jgi:LacI family transcriptional regulator